MTGQVGVISFRIDHSCVFQFDLRCPPISNCAVPFRNRERITFDHLVSMKKPNEIAKLKVLRDGQELDLTVTLQPVSNFVHFYLHFVFLIMNCINDCVNS